MTQRDHAAVVAVYGPNSTVVLVQSKNMPLPFWKFPGGGKENNEIPAETAARELYEETGLQVEPHKLRLLYYQDKWTHDFYFFGITLPDYTGLQSNTAEEIVRIFLASEYAAMKEFFPPHRKLLEKTCMLLTAATA